MRGDIQRGAAGIAGPWLFIGSIDGASNQLTAVMLIEERRHRHLRIPVPK